MIDHLTAEQEARLTEFRDKWLGIGLSTAPAQRRKAEIAIRQSYKLAGIAWPTRIVWCGSPLSQVLTRSVVLNASVGASVRASVRASVGASVWDSVRASVWDSVRASVGDSVRASVGDSVWDSVRASVRASVGASVWDSVRASVGDSVGASVGDSVRDSVRASVRASVGASVGASVYGQHESAWLGFYEYFREVCGLTEQTNKLQGLLAQAKTSGWFLPYQHICWVSERHNTLLRDERGRLHSLAGPAVGYPDGWNIYAVHGVRVPADIIKDKTSITPQRITKEPNAEIRRVMMDIFTPTRFLLESGATPIHADDYGTLYRAELPDDEPLVMVSVINSTPEPDGSRNTYWLRVDPELRPLHPDGTKGEPQELSAHNAIASTFGKRGAEYTPFIQT